MSEFLITPEGVVLELVPAAGCTGCYFRGETKCPLKSDIDYRCTAVSSEGSYSWMEVKDESAGENR